MHTEIMNQFDQKHLAHAAPIPEPSLLFQYEQAVHSSRVGLALSDGLRAFVAEDNMRNLHAFMLFWTAHSISMTEQVEDWIRRAGQRCEALTFAHVGQHLKRHATHEAEHDKLLVEDLKHLIGLWNRRYSANLSFDDMMSLERLPATLNYIQLHEDTISGTSPFAQIAIEFEIERLSVAFGPRMVENVRFVMGHEADRCLTFLTHHVLLDQGHTQFNTKLLENCLAEDPMRMDVLVKTGKSALETYSAFLSECWKATQVLR